MSVLRMLVLAAALGWFPALAAADSKTVRDWTAECDADLTCMATASGVQGMAMGGTGYRLRFSRAGSDMSAWSVRFFLKNVPQPKADGEMIITVDGAAPASFYEEYGYLRDTDGMTFGLAGGPELDKLFTAVKKGRKLALSYETADRKTQTETFSLSGLAAVLLWIDEQQNRVGTSSEISYPPGVEGEAAFTATTAIADKIELRAKLDCDPLPPSQTFAIESYRLPGGFALHVAPCVFAAYNFTQLYFFQRRDDLSQIYFADYYDGWSGTNQLFNSDFDPKTGRLGAFYKGRGVGDCGSAGQWVWSGYSFKLVHFIAWPDCDNGKSADDWLVIYKRQPK